MKNYPLVSAVLLSGCSFNPAIDGPPAGNPDAPCVVPSMLAAADTSNPDRVIGDGTPQSCSQEAVVNAVSKGGIITFNCGQEPLTINMDKPAIIHPGVSRVLLDGGNRIALNGGNRSRIMYLNVCDPSVGWSDMSCKNSDGPEIVIQNITIADGNSDSADQAGGGAIYVNGGNLRVVHSRFFRNVSHASVWTAGGGAIRVERQLSNRPVSVVNSTFGGESGIGNSGLNGGALSLGENEVIIINSIISNNEAIAGPHDGVGGAVHSMYSRSVTICGVRMNDNFSTDSGGAIAFLGGNELSQLLIHKSSLRGNHSTLMRDNYPGIFSDAKTIIESSELK